MSTVLITGANKGIGLGFVKKYLNRPNTTVIAGVRNPTSPEAKAISELPKADGSKVIIVKIENTSDTDAAEAVESIKKQGVDKLDIAIANAGIYGTDAFVKVSEIKTKDLLEHFDVNTAGTVRLFQAVLPLLKKGDNPRFLALSSIVGTIGLMDQIPFNVPSYGSSKAAINFLTRRIHFENEDLISIAVHPGAVQTDNGNAAARFFGLPEANVTLDESVDGLVGILDKASREETSGKFLSYDGTAIPW
ncbi:putative cytochrome 52A4 [Venustampulla echinocandica]|uniref:Putative cytochrome 52A4 n=1 Tax=Venustampulla echinocandica TaxID=2656787 RepID=A0A370U387_9HELO|nr:putative cytochrome 52A4 [Venustampulla echinocandica]RDL42234.1 putative cytochrome 52A4 [Venustampulla echinocandica]